MCRLHVHRCRRRAGNVAEVQAKEGAQETAVTLLGLLMGLACAGVLNSAPLLQWAAFAVLTLIHVIANYAAVRSLSLRTLNRSRSHALVLRFLQQCGGDGKGVDSVSLPSPALLSRTDPVLPLSLLSTLQRAMSPFLRQSVGEPFPLRIGIGIPSDVFKPGQRNSRRICIAVSASADKDCWTARELSLPGSSDATLSGWTACWKTAGRNADCCFVFVHVRGAHQCSIDISLFSGVSPQTQLCGYFAAIAAMQCVVRENCVLQSACLVQVLQALIDGVAAFPSFLRAATAVGWDDTLAQLGDAGVRMSMVVDAACDGSSQPPMSPTIPSNLKVQ